MNKLEQARKSQKALRKVVISLMERCTPQEIINLIVDSELVNEPEQWLAEYLAIKSENEEVTEILITYRGVENSLFFSNDFLAIENFEEFFEEFFKAL